MKILDFLTVLYSLNFICASLYFLYPHLPLFSLYTYLSFFLSLSFSLSLSLTLSFFLSLFLSHTHSLSLSVCLSHTLSLSLSFYPCFSLSLSLSHSLSFYLFLFPTLTLFLSQDTLRLSGGLSLCLSHCATDFRLPFAREWGLFCVRNICEV